VLQDTTALVAIIKEGERALHKPRLLGTICEEEVPKEQCPDDGDIDAVVNERRRLDFDIIFPADHLHKCTAPYFSPFDFTDPLRKKKKGNKGRDKVRRGKERTGKERKEGRGQ
jgi:hypothetical protein